MAIKLTDEQRASLQQLLPAGYSVENLRILPLEVQVASVEEMSAQQIALAAETKKAGPSMINSDGKPTILKVAAWMCHGDCVNLNGDSFVSSELEAMAADLFKAPHFGVMDWNHSAVVGYGDEPKLIGVWYDVEWRKHEEVGLSGLLATGMVFSWLFPEQADSMLADQVRNGTVNFSMACIPRSVEYGEVDGKRASILHDPVFFTVTALDKPPADQYARGKVSEHPDATVEGLKQEAMTAMVSAVSQSPVLATTGTTITINGNTTIGSGTWTPATTISYGSTIDTAELVELREENMELEEQIAQLEAEKAALAEEVATLKAAMPAPYERKHAGTDAEIDALIDTLEAKVAECDTTIAELTTSREALAAELAAANAKVAELEAVKAEFESKAAEVAAVEAAKQVADRLVARKSELPEALVEAHETRTEEARKSVEAKWASMSDEEWEFHKKEELLFGFTGKVGFVQRSKAEGTLIPGAPAENTTASRLGRLIKR